MPAARKTLLTAAQPVPMGSLGPDAVAEAVGRGAVEARLRVGVGSAVAENSCRGRTCAVDEVARRVRPHAVPCLRNIVRTREKRARRLMPRTETSRKKGSQQHLCLHLDHGGRHYIT